MSESPTDNTNPDRDDLWMLILHATASMTLLARGWLTWRWDSPIRSLVWQEDWWTTPLQQWFGISWSYFAKHSEPTLTHTLESLGLFLMVSAIFPWTMMRKPLRWSRWLLIPAGILLVLDATGRWIDADHQWGMAIEHTLQVITPWLLVFWRAKFDRAWRFCVAVAASFTFVGHGLYAAGFYSVPLIFQTMTMQILGCSQESAILFLKVIGILDFVAVAGLWVTFFRRVSLMYMVAWGAATAMARMWAHEGLDPWLAETLVRTSHWSLPLLLLWNRRFSATASPESVTCETSNADETSPEN